MGKVTLVGAGCASGLITVKGLERLKEADVIVYDDLIDSSLLSHAKKDCELIYVGKRFGAHSESQQNINRILIEKAKGNKNVVRLKGGDSFVFARGGEELSALLSENIPFEAVPGVTSSVAVPEFFGIPVTHRDVAQSFTVVTGHTATEKDENYAALAALDGTLVFLMGLHNLEQIVSRLIENGKDKNTPCAVLSKGFQPDGKRFDGTLENIVQEASTAVSPAVFVVGKTAGFNLLSPEKLPLSDVSVTVTGTHLFCEKLCRALEKVGAKAYAYPYLEIVPVCAKLPEDFYSYDYLVFTSANGIDIFFKMLQANNIDFRMLSSFKFACIGSASAKRLREHGFTADLVPNEYTAKELGALLGKALQKVEKALILRSADGSKELCDELEKTGISFCDCHTYEARHSINAPIECKSDYIVFASGSSVKAFFESGSKLEKAVPVCIGEVTAKAFEKYSSRACLLSKKHTAEDIVNIINSAHSKNKEDKDEEISCPASK